MNTFRNKNLLILFIVIKSFGETMSFLTSITNGVILHNIEDDQANSPGKIVVDRDFVQILHKTNTTTSETLFSPSLISVNVNNLSYALFEPNSIGIYRLRTDTVQNGLFFTDDLIEGYITLLKHNNTNYLIFEDDRFALKIDGQNLLDFNDTSDQVTLSSILGSNEIVLRDDRVIVRSLNNTLEVTNSKIHLQAPTILFNSQNLEEFGATGLPGPTGVRGQTGPQGLRGLTGVQGDVGPAGPPGVGVPGPAGPQGTVGPQGATGLQGPQGQTGALGLQGITGLGSQGATGLQGPQGQTGIQGQGITGLQGLTGIQGIAGGQGETGFQGVTGVAGSGDVIPGTAHLRLSMSSTTVQVAGGVVQPTFYLHRYNGKDVALYNSGTGIWELFDLPETALSYNVSSLSSGVNYDVFLHSSGGSLVISTEEWSVSRAEAGTPSRSPNFDLVKQDGVYVLSGERRKLYIGTIHVTQSAGTGRIADGSTQRHLWNYYNQLADSQGVGSSSGGSAAAGNTSSTWKHLGWLTTARISVVVGIAETSQAHAVVSLTAESTGAPAEIGLGWAENDPSSPSPAFASSAAFTNVTSTSGNRSTLVAHYDTNFIFPLSIGQNNLYVIYQTDNTVNFNFGSNQRFLGLDIWR